MLSTAACRSRNLLAITILIAFSFLTKFSVPSASAQTLNILYNFSQNLVPPGVSPYGVLVQDSHGYLYGVTNLGGAYGYGMAYKMTTAGAIQDIWDFSSNHGDPYGRIALDSSGNIYGALWNDTLYELSPSGSSYSGVILHQFGVGSDGDHPLGVTLVGSTLYGVTLAGGANGKGAIYSYNVGSSTYTMLYSFGASGSDGVNPYSGLLYNSGDGRLYGTCFGGGANGDGTLYSIFTDGTGYDEYSFNGSGPGSTGASPAGRLVIIGSKMYGLCSYGGTNAQGDLFVFTHPSLNSYSVSALHSFSGAPDGSYPYSALCVGKDHNLYGITPYGGAYDYGVAFKTIPSTGVTSTLHSFNGVDGFFDDSGTPVAWTPCGLSQGADGNFYGVSYYGGVTAIPGIQNGSGSAFKMTASGALTTLTSFNVQDVYLPEDSGLIQANDGYFYGTTVSGGAFQNGAIYRTDAAGNLSVLHHFNNSAGYYEGSDEYPSLAQGTDGYLYGGTSYGGLYGNGTLWRCSLTGQFSILHQFQLSRDGQYILAPPYQGADGALYGASYYGGGFGSDGTVWRCTTAGQFTVLHNFDSSSTVGVYPQGVFAQDSGTKLYGTSANGYTNPSCAIWSIMPNGSSFSILHIFQNSTEGFSPYGMIPIPGSSPLAFYGTCYEGGSGGDGVVWKYSQTAGLTILHSFTGTGSDGKYPTALKLGPDGNLYGVTAFGGGTGNGVFYELNPNTLAYSTLYSMSAPPQAGNPGVLGPLCLGSDGLFYFTTARRGTYSEGTAVSVDTGLINALDISSSVGVTYTKSGSKAVVTIKNTGHVTLLGPIQLVITGTSPSLTVTNSSGSVPSGFPVTGDPYVTVPGPLPHNILSLKPGATVKVTVTFSGTITSFSDKVYTGRF